ncbi:MAG: MFS transporter [Chloroflexota bacterium]|nr:MFS transporter [Chloroflexota bacterium]
MRAYLDLLRSNPNFARLWLSQVVSLTGDWFNTIALSALVVAYSPQNAGWAVSLLLLARTVPPLLISPFAGVLIDRFDRKALLVWTNYLRALVVIGFLLTTTDAGWLWLIYVLSILQFALAAIFEPCQQAITPSLVERDDLVTANTLNTVTWSVLLAFGAVIGGVVASVVGLSAALLIDAVSFMIAGLLAASVRYQPIRDVAVIVPGAPVERVTFWDGVRYLRRNSDAASTLFVKFAGSLGNVDTLIIIFGTKLFVMGEGGTLSLGILYSAFGLGAVLGPALLNRFNDGSMGRMRILIAVAFAWMMLAWLLLGWAGSLLVVCIGLIVRAMGGSVNWTYSTVILQKVTDDAYLGRVSSWDWALYYLATVITTIVHGALVDAFGGDDVTGATSVTFVVAAIALMVWSLVVRRLHTSDKLAALS